MRPFKAQTVYFKSPALTCVDDIFNRLFTGILVSVLLFSFSPFQQLFYSSPRFTYRTVPNTDRTFAYPACKKLDNRNHKEWTKELEVRKTVATC